MSIKNETTSTQSNQATNPLEALFHAQALVLSQRLVTSYWSGDIDECMDYIDESTLLLDSDSRRQAVGTSQIVAFVSEQRANLGPNYHGRDAEYRVDTVEDSKTCCVQVLFRVDNPCGDHANGAVSQAQLSCSFLWRLEGDGSLKLVMFSRSGTRLAQEESFGNLPTTGDTDDSAQSERNRILLQAHDTAGTTHWIYPNNVIYAAAAHQYTDIHCRDRLIHLRASFAQVLEQLGDIVVQVHRSYAVNPSYISHMDGTELHLTTGAVVPIPIKRVRQVRELLAQHSDKVGNRR